MLFKQPIIKAWFLLLALSIGRSMYAQQNDSLSIIFNQYQFAQGENIIIEAAIENYDTLKEKPQTLHLWVDNITNGKRQKFRYPMLSGYLKLALKVDSTIINGKYAFNFLLDKQFYSINGTVNKGLTDGKKINYIVTAKKKAPVINDITIGPDNSFAIKDFYFLDTVLFGFSPVVKSKENNLQVTISTPLDSAFTPTATATEFIIINKDIEVENKTANPTTYSFVQYKADKKTLQEVVVNGKIKTEGEKFDEENSRGIFAMGDATVLDLLSSNEHLSYTDIFTYITTKFPGIQQATNPESGQPYLRWRNETIDIYVDEVYLDNFSASDISMQDVAIIKVYRQGLRLQGGSLGEGFGGTIAIYTKSKNKYNGNKLSNYTFSIIGYNNLFTEWKNK
jgi:hypothetical protein